MNEDLQTRLQCVGTCAKFSNVAVHFATIALPLASERGSKFYSYCLSEAANHIPSLLFAMTLVCVPRLKKHGPNKPLFFKVLPCTR